MGDAYIVRRGGGASLNYDVVGGTSRPGGSVKENTIWVNTAVNITSHVFSAGHPSSPSAGMVWFGTGKSSSVAINALKKNGLYVYPVSCEQYVSGSWVSKDAKAYQDGEWKAFSPFPMSLIPIEDASLWTLNELGGSYNGSPYGANVTSEGWLYLQSSNVATASATFKEALDFSTAGEITITYSQNWRIKPRISLVNAETGATDFTMTATNTGGLPDLWTAKLDVSTAKGKYYLTLDTFDYAGDMTLYVKSLDITRRS